LVAALTIVIRELFTTHVLKGFHSGIANCLISLLERRSSSYILARYVIKDWRVLAEVDGYLQFLGEADGLRFADTPLGPNMCPGVKHLEVLRRAPDLWMVRVGYEGCSAELPPGKPFCPKHFNTSYGRYLRFIYGGGRPDLSNEFFNMPTLVYTVYYGGDILKVGTSLIIKGLRRLLEQPTYLASTVFITKDITEARSIERWLSMESKVREAPRTEYRVRSVLSSLKRGSEGLEGDLRRFTCLLIKNLLTSLRRAAPLTSGDRVVSTIKGFIERGVVYILDMYSPSDEALLKSRVTYSAGMVNKALRGLECYLAGLARGFLVLNCSDGDTYAIPYELVHDRSLNASLTR